MIERKIHGNTPLCASGKEKYISGAANFGAPADEVMALGQSDYRRIPQDTAGYHRIPQDPLIWTFLMEFSILLHGLVIL